MAVLLRQSPPAVHRSSESTLQKIYLYNMCSAVPAMIMDPRFPSPRLSSLSVRVLQRAYCTYAAGGHGERQGALHPAGHLGRRQVKADPGPAGVGADPWGQG